MVLDGEALVRSLVGFATGALYLFVGRLVLKRSVAGEAATANRFFATWWFGLGVIYVAAAPHGIAQAFGWRDLAFTVAFIDALLLAICVAMWGILCFLLYVYTGSNRWAGRIGIFYALLGFAMLWLLAWMDPIGFKGDSHDIEFTRRLGDWSSTILGLLFSVPIFAAAVAYLTLIFRVKERSPRYRIAMVGGAFAAQFGWSILSAVLGLSRRFPNSRVLLVVNQAIALIVPVIIIMAYRPPAWLTARWAAADAT